jgi:hypothetical protein
MLIGIVGLWPFLLPRDPALSHFQAPGGDRPRLPDALDLMVICAEASA